MSDMIEVSVAGLEGPALDWAVAKAVGLSVTEDCGQFMVEEGTIYLGRVGREYSPSTDWSQGGPLIDDDYIVEMGEYMFNRDEPFYAEGPSREAETGETYLIAVCRVIVASALGDEVEVPVELVEASDA